jgi:type IV pilus assembly protein PilC
LGRFIYQAKNLAGQVQQGQIDATNESEARVKLKAQNLTVLRVLNAPAPKSNQLGFFTPRVAAKDLQVFTRQFSTLINCGIPIVDALKMLSEGKRSAILKDAAIRVRISIEGGRRLGESMASIPNVFDRFYVNMVKAGEEAGILDGILSRLSVYLEKSEKLKKQIVGALSYPAIILFVAAIVITAILIFVIPKFQEMYSSSGSELPALTTMVINMSEFLKAKWYLVIGAFVGGPIGLFLWYRSPSGKSTADRILIRLPLFGDLIQKSSIARMTRTLSTLLSSGVSVIEALEIAARTSGNVVIEEALVRCKESVTVGRPLVAPLTKEKMMPDMVVQMISIGEQTGALDAMLTKIADFYEDDVENAVKSLTSMIEPLLMVGLGVVIAFLVLAMYLPIFNLASAMGG